MITVEQYKAGGQYPPYNYFFRVRFATQLPVAATALLGTRRTTTDRQQIRNQNVNCSSRTVTGQRADHPEQEVPSAAQSVLWLLSLALERKSPDCRAGPAVLIFTRNQGQSPAETWNRHLHSQPRNKKTARPHNAAQTASNPNTILPLLSP